MNRIEILRKQIDKILLNMTDVEERRCAYLHLLGTKNLNLNLALRRIKTIIFNSQYSFRKAIAFL